MRARPEPTPLEHLPDVSFMGKLLVLPENVRLDWKVIASYKHTSLFCLAVSDIEKKGFITVAPGFNVIKLFPLLMMMRPNKLEHLSLETLSSRVLELEGKGRANPIGAPFIYFLLG